MRDEFGVVAKRPRRNGDSTNKEAAADAPSRHPLHALQRRLGNRATLALLDEPQRPVVGPADDKYEREADAAAEKVTAAVEPGTITGTRPVVQRRSTGGSDGQAIDRATSEMLDAARGSGAPLPSEARAPMERAFGEDFSSVRVHSDSASTALNDRVQAKAFTLGQDIFFRGRTPDVATSGGRELLAHELTHTIQQRAGTDAIARSPLVIQRWNPFKKKAKDDGGDLVISGPRNGRVMGETTAPTTNPGVSTTAPKKKTTEKKKTEKKKKPSGSDFVVSGPRNGRVMGEQPPQQVPKAKPIPKYDFMKDDTRRAKFLEWAHQHPEAQAVSDELMRVDLALSSLNTVPASLDEALLMVQILLNSPDPEVQKVVRESVQRFRLNKLEDNFISEEQYRSKYGGLRQLQGIEGKLNYYTLDLYSGFQGGPEYQLAMTTKKVPPPVPSTEGRGELSTEQSELEKEVSEETEPVEMNRGGMVSALAKQLEGKINFGPPGSKPPSRPLQDTSENDTSDVPAPEQEVKLTDREDPRETERKVLTILDQGGKVPPKLLKQLGQKIGKSQSRSRGRKVTKSTEEEFGEIMSKLPKEQAVELKKAMTDYTQDSAAINTHARGIPNATNQQTAMENVDKVFEVFDKKGFTKKNRITYRLASYKTGQEIPYGATIKVGDFIMDKAFVSASENRQIISQGPEHKVKGTRYVKFTIMGAGGANISGGSLYTNANEKMMAERHGGVKDKLLGAQSGQAEVLYRRNSVFRVDAITEEDGDLHVIVTAVPVEDGEGKLKNSFNGAPTSIAKG